MPRTQTPPAHRSHYVVDGSNIATEGRSHPSLQQLNDAVMAFIDEHPDAFITVVVDATFGHRIDKKEVKEFDEAVANNELVTPPAGAVGRGDAFVLSIANKAKANILSNDSFQEFHGDYPWLFDEGRLIGGKPVPHVGWVFVERLPVRGPKSRQSVKEAKQDRQPSERRGAPARGSGSPLAAQPMPVPTAPPPGAVVAAKTKRAAQEPAPVDLPAAAAQVFGKASVNDLLPFLDFVERHPIGTSCTVVVESYASHGAYARAGDVLVYLPLRLMGNPPPRSARAAVSVGEAIAVVVAGYVPERRSIDAALPSAIDLVPIPAAAPAKRGRKRAAAATVEQLPEPEAALAEPPAASIPEAEEAKPRRTRRAKAAATPAPTVTPASAATVAAPVEQAAGTGARPAKKAAAKTPAKTTAKTTAKKAAAKTPAETPAAKVPAAKVPAARAPAAKAPAAKAPAAKKQAAEPNTQRTAPPSSPAESVPAVSPKPATNRSRKVAAATTQHPETVPAERAPKKAAPGAGRSAPSVTDDARPARAKRSRSARHKHPA